MGTFNAALFMAEILATIAFFVVLQAKSTEPEDIDILETTATGEDGNELKKAA